MPLKISIVTPSFNQGRFLQQTMRSVLEQGCDVEYIVIDGGSTDGSAELLDRYSRRLAYWHSRRDGGQTDALNQGLARATGDVVGWINSDDYYLPNAFRSALQRFESPDRPDVVYGNTITVGDSGAFIRENRHGRFSLRHLAATGMDINQQAMFWRRELNAAVLPLDSGLRFCMDLELVVRLARCGATFARIPAFLGAFRLHGASKTTNLDDVRRSEEANILERYGLANERVRTKWLDCVGAHLARRAAIVADGAWRYAVLGGRMGASCESRRLNALVSTVPGGWQ